MSGAPRPVPVERRPLKLPLEGMLLGGRSLPDFEIGRLSGPTGDFLDRQRFGARRQRCRTGRQRFRPARQAFRGARHADQVFDGVVEGGAGASPLSDVSESSFAPVLRRASPSDTR